MVEDLSDVIAEIATGTYTVTRYTSPGYVNGRAQPAVASTFGVLGCLQPLSGRQLDRLPENLRGREVMSLYCTVELKTGGEGVQPDVVAADGATWQVQQVERWATLGNYYRVLLCKQGR